PGIRRGAAAGLEGDGVEVVDDDADPVVDVTHAVLAGVELRQDGQRRGRARAAAGKWHRLRAGGGVIGVGHRRGAGAGGGGGEGDRDGTARARRQRRADALVVDEREVERVATGRDVV